MQESGKGQLTLEMRRPSQFMRLLGDTRKRLIPMANAEGAEVVDENFAFGFERYLEEGSELPSPVHVPRLAHQLLILDRVCSILFEEGVTKLTTTRREVFEGGPVVSRRRSGAAPVQSDAGELKEGDLYARMRFSVDFEARESALVRAIDRLASNELFIVVNSLDCRKVGEDIAMEKIPESGTLNLNPDEEGLEVDQLGRLFPSRYERVISGAEAETPMAVTLSFDVYRFAEVTSP
ncbi:MAG: hypothetical protein GWM98_06750 [Nitrospinaceae bacterium]|nr:hypothetical protein [Nitrospinaceae bacterium]